MSYCLTFSISALQDMPLTLLITYAESVRYIDFDSRRFPSIVPRSKPLLYNTRPCVVSSKDFLGLFKQIKKITNNAMPGNEVETQTPTLSMIDRDRGMPTSSRLELTQSVSRSSSSFQGYANPTSSRSSLRLLCSECRSLVVGCHSFPRISTEFRYCLCRHEPSLRQVFASRVSRHLDMAVFGCCNLRVSLRGNQM